jgi:predicted ATPase
MIHWTGATGQNKLSPEQETRLFKLYNLVSLQLNTDEIRLLADILAWDPVQAYQEGEMNDVGLMFSFVITGAVGAGKSSVISHFRSLKQHDEWTEPRLDQMAKDPEGLGPDDLQTVDDWVAKQFRLRNNVLNFNDNQIGLHILDRGPLDPLAFTPKIQSVSAKAKRLRSSIKGRSKAPLSGAHVIVLKGEPTVLNARAIAQGKDFSVQAIAEQQDKLVEFYGKEGVTVIETHGLSLEDVVRSVAFDILDQQHQRYSPLSFDDRLEQVGASDLQTTLRFTPDAE